MYSIREKEQCNKIVKIFICPKVSFITIAIWEKKKGIEALRKNCKNYGINFTRKKIRKLRKKKYYENNCILPKFAF